MSFFYFHTCGPSYHHSLISSLHPYWWKRQKRVEVLEQAKQSPKATKTKLGCDQYNLEKKDVNVINAPVPSREGYPGAWLWPAKLCWSFTNIQVLEKKLGYHSAQSVGLYWGTQEPTHSPAWAAFEKPRHHEKLQFFTCEISTAYVLLLVKVCVFLPLQ